MKILKPIQRNDTFVVKTNLINIVRLVDVIKYKKGVKKKTIEKEFTKEFIVKAINDIVNNTNQLVIQTYYFLKLWILMKYENNVSIPKITEDTIKLIFRVLSVTEKECALSDEDNKRLYIDIENFYNNHYSKLYYHPKFICDGYRQIFNYMATDIVTNINNNIKIHFLDYVKCYVNGVYYMEYNDNLTKANNQKLRKFFKKEAYRVKLDLINNTRKSKYTSHDWIVDTQKNIFPQIDNEQQKFGSNLTTQPQEYLSNMIYMNKELEHMGRKMFHVLPLRTSCIPKYIPIDTEIIIKLLIHEGRADYSKNITRKANEIWNKFFDLDDKIFRKKGYKFNNLIYTDGFAVSIMFLSDAKYQKKVQKFDNVKKVKTHTTLLCEGKTKEEIIEIKKNIKMNKLKQKEEAKTKRAEEFKKISKEDKAKLKLERLNALNTEDKKVNAQAEFPYLEDLTSTQLENLKESKLVYIDPGKIRLYTMIDDNNTVFKYSNGEYMKRTKRKEYNKKLTKFREKEGITNLEWLLSKYNSKSCNYKTFNRYVYMKNRCNDILLELHKAKIFRQLKFYSYIMKQREIDRLTRIIGETYGEDCKLIMGDWCPSVQMRNHISTPMIGLKRKLGKKFEIINLDEYKTSKLCYLTEEETKNLVLPVQVPKRDKNNKVMRDENKNIITELVSKKIHSILTFKMKGLRRGLINRDINAVKNMRKIVKHWFKSGVRLENYKRSPPENGLNNVKKRTKKVNKQSVQT